MYKPTVTECSLEFMLYILLTCCRVEDLGGGPDGVLVSAVALHGPAGQLGHGVHLAPVGRALLLVVAPRVQDVLPVAVVRHEELQMG